MNYFKKLFPDPPLTLFLLLPEICLKTTINVSEVDLGLIVFPRICSESHLVHINNY